MTTEYDLAIDTAQSASPQAGWTSKLFEIVLGIIQDWDVELTTGAISRIKADVWMIENEADGLIEYSTLIEDMRSALIVTNFGHEQLDDVWERVMLVYRNISAKEVVKVKKPTERPNRSKVVDMTNRQWQMIKQYIDLRDKGMYTHRQCERMLAHNYAQGVFDSKRFIEPKISLKNLARVLENGELVVHIVTAEPVEEEE